MWQNHSIFGRIEDRLTVNFKCLEGQVIRLLNAAIPFQSLTSMLNYEHLPVMPIHGILGVILA